MEKWATDKYESCYLVVLNLLRENYNIEICGNKGK
jgi:hypothetical protein